MDASVLRARGRLPGGREGARDEPRCAHRRDQEGAHPRARRRRLRLRHEDELHAQGVEEAALPRGQRRRGRAGHVQRSLHHGAESALAGRGLHHRLLRHRRARRLTSTCATSCTSRRSGSGAPIEEARAKGYLGKSPFGKGLPDRRPRPHRRGRVHLRRGDGAAQLARGASRRAAHQAAVPGAVGRVRLPDHGEQRRDHRHLAHGADARGRRVQPALRAPRVQRRRLAPLRRERAREEARHLRGPRRASRCASSSTTSAAASWGAEHSSGSFRAGPRARCTFRTRS